MVVLLEDGDEVTEVKVVVEGEVGWGDKAKGELGL